MGAFKTFEQLEKAARVVKVTPVDTSFGKVLLRPLSIPARDRLRQANEGDSAAAMAALLAGSVCDESGALVMTDLGRWQELIEQADGSELEELAKQAARLSGLAKEVVSEAAGESGATPSAS
mgnify:CR=1 FL=1